MNQIIRTCFGHYEFSVTKNDEKTLAKKFSRLVVLVLVVLANQKLQNFWFFGDKTFSKRILLCHPARFRKCVIFSFFKKF